jgi:hypothetical protein
MGMKAPVTGNGEGREVTPAGKYMGVCNAVFLLGTQPGYQGGTPRQQIMLGFELHKRKGPALNAAGLQYEASAIMTFTANVKSKLIEFAGALEGKPFTEEDLELIKGQGGFDPEGLLGKCCWVDVIAEKKPDGTLRDKIKGVSALDPDDDQAPEPLTDEQYWDWTQGVECPKRIAYFWDRALENPDRKGEAATMALAGTGPSTGFRAPTGDDLPAF